MACVPRYLTADPGNIVICSGPYATEAEADAVCGDGGGGGGTGGGTGAGCIGGACSDPDIAPFLYATVTNKTGNHSSIPSSLTFACFTVGAEHFWLCTVNVTIGSLTSKPSIGANTGPPLVLGASVPGIIGQDADAGYTCTPFAAVFHFDDGAGNSSTMTVIA